MIHNSQKFVQRFLMILLIANPVFAIDNLENLNSSTDSFREYNFNSSNQVYTLENSLKNTGVGEFKIFGVVDNDSKSVLDLNNKQGFAPQNNTILSIADLEIRNGYVEGYSIGSALSVGRYNYNSTSQAILKNVSFIDNKSNANGAVISAGALFNSGTVTMENVLFENNTNTNPYTGNLNADGGAVTNINTITSITGKFINNSAITHDNTNSGAYGGAIFTGNLDREVSAYIGDIKADFYGNSVINKSTGSAIGGAIGNNGGEINSITGDFIENYASSELGSTNGGAIINFGKIVAISSDFIGNYASGKSANGGAIYNQTDTIGSITGDFIGNYATGSSASGGVIFNAGYKVTTTIGDITGDFIDNYAKSISSSVYGGTIENYGFSNGTATINSITGNFIANYAESTSSSVFGGAIDNYAYKNSTAKISNITGDFIGNYASCSRYVYGGAIHSYASINSTAIIGDIIGDFIGNYASGSYAHGGAIYNYADSTGSATIAKITGDFLNNYVSGTSYAHGGVINNYAAGGIVTIGDITGDFIGNYASGLSQAFGGAIYNYASGTNSKATIGDISGDFIGNYAESTNGTAQGGAIWSNSNITLVADNKDIQIQDNYTLSKGIKDDNAIYMASDSATLKLDIKNSGTLLLKDNIDGVTGYNVNIVGDNTGILYLQNDIRNADLSIGNITLKTLNNNVHNYNVNSLTITNDINMIADVDLATSSMDRFTASNFGSHSGKINVVGMNLLSDAISDVTNVPFAQDGLKENVTLGFGEAPTSYQAKAYTPIYKYNVSYDKSNGNFAFQRLANDKFNPAVLGGSTTATVGAIGTMNQTFGYAFNNADSFMNIPYLDRIAIRDRNKYAVNIGGTDGSLGRFSPLFQPADEQEDVWIKTYSVFENVPLKNGPTVNNVSYGTLIGYDTPIKSIKKGWDRVLTGYIGYNGANQSFANMDSTQNGGLLGGTVTLYKGNFFNASTISAGASVAENRSMYGNDNFTMLISGIGNKTGYNLEFNKGRFILQPNLLLSYTFVNTFDYTNAAGVRIDNKPLHAIQVAPGVKFIGNLNNGWQPYASVNMVWNIMGKSDATANGVKLPSMSIKPYVQYGLGIQKRIKDHFLAYGQAMIQNGGRNGISLTAGFRWAFGHDDCYYENKTSKIKKINKTKSVKKVQPKTKKVLKESKIYKM